MTILEAIDDPVLFGPSFADAASWTAWRAFLAACFGLLMTEEQLSIFRQHTGRQTPPAAPASEAWLIVGRRGGKSRIAALVAVFLACFRDYRHVLTPGERGTLPVIATDRHQARTVFRYITGLIDSVPMLGRLVERRTRHGVELTNGVTIEVHTASFRAIRGYTVIGAVCDEIAFWRSEESANPDTEILNGLRPGMATVPGALLLCISTPYARRGCLWEAYRQHHGRDGDALLVWQATTRDMNPTVPDVVIAEAYEQDQAAAAAEYGAEFRRDVEAFLTREAIESVVVPGRRELPPVARVAYVGFCDPSGGSQDAMTLAIAHRDGERIVLDAVRERRPPFSPDAVVAEFAALLQAYGVSTVTGDRYAGEWPRERFRAHGMAYEVATRSKSELYGALLPAINSGRVELLDHPRLVAQLCGLERRVGRGGRDSIDHGSGGHDDLANAVAGALTAEPAGPVPAFVRRRALVNAMIRPERRHPFSRLETTLRDGVAVLPEAFDRGIGAPRAAHLALAPDRQTAALAVGYVRGLASVQRPGVAIGSAVPEGISANGADDRSPGIVQQAPAIVLEALLRIVAPPDDEVVVEELAALVVALREDAGVPLRWVTTGPEVSLVARQLLRAGGCMTGELAAEALPRAYAELKAALYDGRLETYGYPPLLEELAALSLEEAEAGVAQPTRGEKPAAHRPVAEAAAGVVHVLARREESWRHPGTRPQAQRWPRGYITGVVHIE